MEPARRLRHRIENNQLTLGMLISFHLSMELIEIAIKTGLDYVIVDSEHLDHGQAAMADACSMGRVADFAVLVRPAATDFDTVHQIMDLGPAGLLLPMVETAEQLDSVRDGIYMPPRGKRRPGGPGNRWLEDRFNYADFKAVVEDHLIIVPQIESPLGLEQADAIAAHPITTALGIGPYDLSARLGVCWEPDHPKNVAALERIRQAATAAGKPNWVIGDGRQRIEQGFHFLCIAEPSMMLQTALTQLVVDLRGPGKCA